MTKFNWRLLWCFPVVVLGVIPACGDDKAQDVSASQTTAPAETGEASNSETGGVTTSGPGSTSEAPTTTTTTSVPSTSGDDTEDTVSFFMLTTGGTIGQCDPFVQDCPDGEKCAAYAEGGGSAWNSHKCVPVTGTGAAGDLCTTEGGAVSGFDDCAKGFMCWNVSAENVGYCVEQCTGTEANPTCLDTVCTYFSNPLWLCLPTCDPLLQDCPGTDVCVPVGGEFVCVLDASGDGGVEGDPCEYVNSCDKGLACMNTSVSSDQCDPNASGCCMPFCEFPDEGDTCKGGTQCVQWYDAEMGIPPGKEDIGICVIPS